MSPQGTEAHACNPNISEAEAGRSTEVRSWRPAWPTWQNPMSTKNTKVSQARWRAPVILATQEAEAGESLEHVRQVVVSQDRATALQPGQQGETLPQKTHQVLYLLPG